MRPNQQSIEAIYSAFARFDADTMAASYADDASFDDEVFSLRGQREVGGMLCEAPRSRVADVWKLAYRDVQADAGSGQAHYVLGWTPLLRNKVQRQAGAILNRVLA